MTDTKSKIQEIIKKSSNPNVSLSEIANLTIELNKIIFLLIQDKEKKEERKLSREAAKTTFNAVLNYIDKWIKGEINLSSDADVSFIHGQFEGHKSLGANWATYEKNINENEKLDEDEKQDFIKLLKGNIEEIKKREADLMKLFQRWQEKRQSKFERFEEDSDLDDSNKPSPEEKTEQINLLNQKILELQNRIEELEKNQNSTNPEIQQKVAGLQKQKEKIQSQLNKLQNDASPRSTSSDTPSSRNKKGKGFLVWGIILIVLGVLIAAGLVTYFILEKKNQPKLKKAK